MDEELHAFMLRKAYEKQCEILFDGIYDTFGFTARSWKDLFPEERQSVLDLESKATEAWWKVIHDYLEDRRNERANLLRDNMED